MIEQYIFSNKKTNLCLDFSPFIVFLKLRNFMKICSLVMISLNKCNRYINIFLVILLIPQRERL